MSWIVLALPNFAAGASMLAVGLAVLLARPGPRNFWLGISLATMSGSYAFLGLTFSDDPATSGAAWRTAHVFFILEFAAYACFFGTMGGALGRFFGKPFVRGALVGGALWGCYLVLGPAAIAGDALHKDYTPIAHIVLRLVIITIWSLGLIVAFTAWRSARSPLERRQLAAYVLGFAVFDAGNILLQLWVLAQTIGLLPDASSGLFNALLLPSCALFLVGALGWGLLRAQLFGVELRLRWTLRRGTVAAAFVGVFFVVSEGAQDLFSARFGAIAGLAAAGALVFALAPLQRVADRLADAALPGVRDDPEYRLVRKREVYQAAVEGVLHDGEITARERTVLARLQDQLGLTALEALEIERRSVEARREQAA